MFCLIYFKIKDFILDMNANANSTSSLSDTKV